MSRYFKTKDSNTYQGLTIVSPVLTIVSPSMNSSSFFQEGFYRVRHHLAFQIKMDFWLSCSLRKTMKNFLNDQFRVYFKSAVEQISLEFAEFKLNRNNH